MKQFLLLALTSLFAISLHGQDVVIKASKEISLEATPKQIIDSLKKKFPNAQAIHAYKVSEAQKNGWDITKEDETSPNHSFERYTLSFKNKNFKYYALFAADGTLLKSKFEQYGATLPAGTKASLQKLAGDQYKAYRLISKTYYKTVDYDKKKSYYQIVAVNIGNENIKKTITLDEEGKVVKVIDN
ncbi:hypothetical protein ACFGVR_10950 [Mucilaginibacter sp. AW1-3]